jgi:formamidopyrimidine-DNA glycosylase
MPELPEVEVTRLGLHPHIIDKKITGITIRQPKLRWPVPESLNTLLENTFITRTQRRGKYLLLEISKNKNQILGESCVTLTSDVPKTRRTTRQKPNARLADKHPEYRVTEDLGRAVDCAEVFGWLIFHLGMSGTLRLIDTDEPASIHDHIDLHLGEKSIRLRDPRRFGALLWHPAEQGCIEQYRLLASLGVEPLTESFNGITGAQYLYQHTRTRQQAIKQVLLAGQIVVGVGNIYASEALFHARIHPKTPANKIGLKRYVRLVAAIRQTLQAAIDKGGSSLRDFVASDGSHGYFQLDYMVYGKTNQPCRVCNTPIRQCLMGQRSTFFCPRCQRA